jgi:hypothetical protein
LETVEKQTGKTPQMLLEEPDLHITIAWVWTAYNVLDKGRQWGYNGPQPILVSEIEAYCRLNEIEDRSDLIRYIQKMDNVYLKDHREKMERKYKSKK